MIRLTTCTESLHFSRGVNCRKTFIVGRGLTKFTNFLISQTNSQFGSKIQHNFWHLRNLRFSTLLLVHVVERVLSSVETSSFSESYFVREILTRGNLRRTPVCLVFSTFTETSSSFSESYFVRIL